MVMQSLPRRLFGGLMLCHQREISKRVLIHMRCAKINFLEAPRTRRVAYWAIRPKIYVI